MGVEILQQNRFPEQMGTTFTIKSPSPKTFTLRIRKPAWAFDGVNATLNGKPVTLKGDTNGFLALARNWRNGDRLEIEFHTRLYTEAMPDNPDRIAILKGPIVLAGTLGREMPDPVFGTPVLMTTVRDPRQWLKPDGNRALQVRMSGVGKPMDVSLRPFYEIADEYYSVYWDFFSPQQWTAREAGYRAEQARMAAIAARTIDDFRVGEMQPERDHQLTATERSYVSDALGRMGREARTGHHFRFTMKVLPDAEHDLLVTLIGDDKDRVFDILVDGRTLTTVEWKGGQTGRFYDQVYPIPGDWTRGKTAIDVRIEAGHGKTAGRIFSVKTLRKSP
jgi:hypothetical protein